MLDTILLVVIVIEEIVANITEYKTFLLYKKYFKEREAWRLAQRKSRSKKTGQTAPPEDGAVEPEPPDGILKVVENEENTEGTEG